MSGSIRKFRDAYGIEALCVADRHGPGWKVTLRQGGIPHRSVWCSGWREVNLLLSMAGHGWTEVDRWQVTTLTE